MFNYNYEPVNSQSRRRSSNTILDQNIINRKEEKLSSRYTRCFFHNIFNEDEKVKFAPLRIKNPLLELFKKIKETNTQRNDVKGIEISVKADEVLEVFEVGLYDQDNKNYNESTLEDHLIYTLSINDMILYQFLKFGRFYDFDSLIKKANKLYEKTDQISKFIDLISINKHLEEEIMSRNKNKTRIEKEIIMIFNATNEILNLKNFNKFTIVNIQNKMIEIPFSLSTVEIVGLDEVKMKIYFERKFPRNKLEKLIRIFYEIESYGKWVPSITTKIHRRITKSKRSFYGIFDLPIIDKRKLLCYQFINNKFKQNECSIQFLSQSDVLQWNEKDVKSKDFIQADKEINLINSSFELKYKPDYEDSEKILLEGFIYINPKLKYMKEDFANFVCKQYMSSLLTKLDDLINLDNAKFDETIPISKDGDDFYKFIYKYIDKYVFGDFIIDQI